MAEAVELADMSVEGLARFLSKKLDAHIVDILRNDKITGNYFLRLAENKDLLKELFPALGDRIAVTDVINELSTQNPGKQTRPKAACDSSESGTSDDDDDDEDKSSAPSSPERTGLLCSSRNLNAPQTDAANRPAEAQDAVGIPSKRWHKEILKVYFIDRTPSGDKWRYGINSDHISTTKILEWANEWHLAVPQVPGFEITRKIDQSDIRVTFSDTGTSWSLVGTDAEHQDYSEQTTMTLNLATGSGETDYKHYLVLHEFGHALGLEHEHQFNPVAPHMINKKKMIAYLQEKCGYSLQNAEATYEDSYAPQAARDVLEHSPYDRKSVMHYWVPAECIKRKYRSKFPSGVTTAKRLSEMDKEWIGKLYSGDFDTAGGAQNGKSGPNRKPGPTIPYKRILTDEGPYSAHHETEETEVKLIATNAVEISDILRESGFSYADWEDLAAILNKPIAIPQRIDIRSIKKDQTLTDQGRLRTVIEQWLNKDTNATWETLANGVTKLSGYGLDNAKLILKNAGVA